MDVSRDPFGAIRGAVNVLVQRILSEFGVEVGDAGLEFDFWRRFPGNARVRGNDKRLELTIKDIARSRRDVAAIVVVNDADGDGPKRLATLKAGRESANNDGVALAGQTVIGVAVQMVEAWLLGDHNEVARVLSRAEGGRDPEGHSDPKAVLAEWADAGGKDLLASYDELAKQCKLAVVADRCPSFKKFIEDFRSHRP
jgi:hypothetical protein